MSGSLASRGYFGGASSAGPVVVGAPPIISIVRPAVLLATTPITVTVVADYPLRRVFISARYAGLGIDEVVHNRVFGVTYTGLTNARTTDALGYTFTLLRDGGWPGALILDVTAIDSTGSMTTTISESVGL